MDPTLLNARALLILNDAEYEQNEEPKPPSSAVRIVRASVTIIGAAFWCGLGFAIWRTL